MKHVLKKYDTNRDGKIGREEMNTGSKRIATEYQRSTNTLRAQNPERQKLQANAKKERSDLVKCIQNPTKCVSKVNSLQIRLLSGRSNLTCRCKPPHGALHFYSII